MKKTLKNIFVIALLILSLLTLTACGKEEETKNESPVSSEAEQQEQDLTTPLTNTYNFIVAMWSDVINETKYYIEDGTNSTGNTYTYSKVIKRADELMAQFDEYDSFIKNLDDTKFSDLKNIWKDISVEMKSLYNKLKSEEPKAKDSNYDFKTDKYRDLMYDFSDEAYK